MTVKDIFELRRQGKTEEAYLLILEQYKNYHGHYTTICMFWCATDMAKLQIERGNFADAAKILASLMRLYPNLEDEQRYAHRALMNIATLLSINDAEHFKFDTFKLWWDKFK
ncbi:MAG TPA: hypothetical protein DCG33_07745 [Prevotellaceae bacterium]|nr:hypothetical protein [Prevotellaceae bacterium]